MTKQDKVKALVLTGFGINCDNETAYAFEKAGAQARRVHINELTAEVKSAGELADCHILAVDGGFSWGDDHGAGVILGLKLTVHLGRAIERFIERGGLVIGICNGFQALVNMGLLPGFDGDRQARSVALMANERGNFRDQWVELKIEPESRCVWTKGLARLSLPVRHGEGRFYAETEALTRLNAQGQVALRYADQNGEPARGVFPANPNGSLADIAGISDETGRVFGLMPHPEAFHTIYNYPGWTRLADQAKREGRTFTDEEGQGLAIFKNAVRYVRENPF